MRLLYGLLCHLGQEKRGKVIEHNERHLGHATEYSVSSFYVKKSKLLLA